MSGKYVPMGRAQKEVMAIIRWRQHVIKLMFENKGAPCHLVCTFWQQGDFETSAPGVCMNFQNSK